MVESNANVTQRAREPVMTFPARNHGCPVCMIPEDPTKPSDTERGSESVGSQGEVEHCGAELS